MALTLSAVPNPGTTPPSMQVQVLEVGSSVVSSVTLRRLLPDGSSSLVRSTDGQPFPMGTVNGQRGFVTPDVEAPFGVPLVYEANGAYLSGSATLLVTVPWLVHLGVPSRSMPITITDLASRRAPVQQGVFQVIGRRNPIVVTSGARSGDQGSLSVVTETITEGRALDDLLADASPLLLNTPASSPWLFAPGYVSIGDVTASPVGALGVYSWVLPFQVVDAPLSGSGTPSSGGGTGTRTWADVGIEEPTWGDLGAAYATWGDVATGVKA